MEDWNSQQHLSYLKTENLSGASIAGNQMIHQFGKTIEFQIIFRIAERAEAVRGIGASHAAVPRGIHIRMIVAAEPGQRGIRSGFLQNMKQSLGSGFQRKTGTASDDLAEKSVQSEMTENHPAEFRRLVADKPQLPAVFGQHPDSVRDSGIQSRFHDRMWKRK